jgi:excisionase family DNA binding protein
MSSELLFLEEVAAMARTPLSTVRYWVATGKLGSLRPGRRRFVRRSELERFLAEVSRPASRAPRTSGDGER